jgi:carbamoyltransferase
MSGFRDCLAISLDGVGDSLSGLVCSVRGGELETLRSLSVPESLGLFYLSVIHYLGYDLFDEYKVMGLAPYGDPAVYREALQTAYKLLPEGRWSICKDRLVEALNAYPARRQGAGKRLPMLLNTSLNIKGEPLVNNWKDAEHFATQWGVKIF